MKGCKGFFAWVLQYEGFGINKHIFGFGERFTGLWACLGSHIDLPCRINPRKLREVRPLRVRNELGVDAHASEVLRRMLKPNRRRKRKGSRASGLGFGGFCD